MTILRRHISADKGANFKFFLLQTLFLAPAEAIRTAIPHLTQFVFAKGRQKQNQLNLPPHNNMVWRDGATLFARGSAHKVRLRQHGIFMLKTCGNTQVKNIRFDRLILTNNFNTLVR